MIHIAVVLNTGSAWAVNLALPENSPDVEVIGHPQEGGGAPGNEHLRINDNLIPPNGGNSLLVRTDLGSAVHQGIGYDFGGLAVGVTDITIWEKNDSLPEAVTVYYDRGSKSFTNIPMPVVGSKELILSLDNVDTRYVYVDFEAPDPSPLWDISEIQVEGLSLETSVARVQPVGHTLNGSWNTSLGFDPEVAPYGARVESPRTNRTANGFSSLMGDDSIQFDFGSTTFTSSIGINQANTSAGGIVYDMLEDVLLEFSDDPTFNTGVTTRDFTLNNLLGYQLVDYIGVDAQHVRMSASSVYAGGPNGGGEVGLSGILFYNSTGGMDTIATRFNWKLNELGDWGTNSNWSPLSGISQGPRANNSNHTAIFGDSITTPTLVATMAAVTVNRIEFNNNMNSYVVSGLGSVNMASSTAATVVTPTMSVTGSHEFQADVNLHNETSIDVTNDSQLIFDGVLRLGGNTLTKTGLGTIAVNNKISLGAGGMFDVLEGTLAGNGTLGGNVDNDSGTIAPGNSVGVLTINGDLSNGAGGTVAIEIEGTDGAGEVLGHDQLQVTGSSTLAGTLDITTGAYSDSTVRATVDSFTLITAAGGSTGTFDTVNYNGDALTASQGNGVFRNMIDDANNVTLENLVALEGDADGDKDIDITDFNILASNFDDAGANSATNDWTTADFDLDSDIDITDFNFLAANFADTGYNIVSLAGGQVPEPGTLAMLLFGGLLGFWAWRRQPTN